MFECVVFDLDGTLLNTLDDLADAGNYALRRMGFPEHDTDKYRYFVGNGIPKLISRIVPKGCDDDAINGVHDFFTDYYEKHCFDKTRPYDQITVMLGRIKEKGIKTAVATNKDHNFSVKLVGDFFGNKIDMVCGRKDGSPKKPDPYSVNYILNSLKADKKTVLYVGDSNVDMETALNAGVKSCGVLWGFRTKQELIESGAVYIAASVEELYRLITDDSFIR